MTTQSKPLLTPRQNAQITEALCRLAVTHPGQISDMADVAKTLADVLRDLNTETGAGEWPPQYPSSTEASL